MPSCPTPNFFDFPSVLREARTDYSVAIPNPDSNRITGYKVDFRLKLREYAGFA